MIDNCDSLNKAFYSGPSRRLLVFICMTIIVERYGGVWKDQCLWYLELGYLKKLVITQSKVKYNLIEESPQLQFHGFKRDNSKLKKNTTNFHISCHIDA